jgi:hypothetical protein
VLAAALEAMGKPPAYPVLARITVDRRDLEPEAGATASAPGSTAGATAGAAPFRFDALERRLARYHDKKVPVWLALDMGPVPMAGAGDVSQNSGAGTAAGAGAKAGAAGARTPNAGPAASGSMTDAWTRLLRGLASRLAGRVQVFELIVPRATAADAGTIALDLKRAAVELRAVNPDIVIALGAAHQEDAADLERAYTADLGAYLDAVVIDPRESAAIGVESSRALLDRVDRTATVYEHGRTLSGAVDAAAKSFVTTELWRLGTASTLASYSAPPATVRAALVQAATIQDLLAGDITPLDAEAAHLTVTRADGRPVRATLIYDVATFGTYLVYAPNAPGGAADSVRVSLTIASDTQPRIRDPLTGTARETTGFARERDAQRTAFAAPLAADRPLIVDFNDALADVLAERNEVKGRALLSVAEIIARHQQARAAQDALIQHYTAAARMEQHFRPSVADPGYDVVTENRFYVDGDDIEWEELSFSVNGSVWKENRPPFPLLQPEKVLSVPLTLRLSDDYHYRLEGLARVDDRECYVVQFDPSRSDRSLFRGTIWIDTATFVQRKLQAVQTKLSAPVVSNEETHYFTTVATVRGREIILPTRMVAKQIVLVAGRNMLVEKATTFSGHQLNEDAFSERRQIARASNRIMYRDTDRGVRYYVKENGSGPRVVSERSTTSAKAMAMGVTIDPSFDFPLPIFGINYLDFDFGGPDSQLALLFGGVLALGNVQRPKLLGTPFDASVDFFAIAVPGSDKIYDESGERDAERILTWPMSTGVNLGYQFTSFQKIALQYQFQFNAYVHDRTTAEDYVLPKSTATHGLGLAYEYRRRGYSLTGNGTWYGRARWAPWGPADEVMTTARTYEKYSVNVSKDWYLGLFQKLHANGAYFGGTRLDRFSQYQFGLFDDTRIHGVPASGVRMSELAMVRGAYTFNIFEQYRFDLFLEQAFGRDKVRLTDWERITGLGVALNVKGPWNTILRVDAGQSFLPSRYRTNGSTVVQVLMLKPLGKG